MVKRETVCFRATKIVKVPTRVSFKTKSGERVSFDATKLERRPTTVCFKRRK